MFNFFGHLKWKNVMSTRKSIYLRVKITFICKFSIIHIQIMTKLETHLPLFRGAYFKKFWEYSFFYFNSFFLGQTGIISVTKKMDEYISELIIFNNSIISQQHQFFARVDVWFLIYDYNKKKLSTSRRNKSNIHYESKNDWFKANSKTIVEILNTNMQLRCKCNKEDNQKK